jgi:hypothetical protein
VTSQPANRVPLKIPASYSGGPGFIYLPPPIPHPLLPHPPLPPPLPPPPSSSSSSVVPQPVSDLNRLYYARPSAFRPAGTASVSLRFNVFRGGLVSPTPNSQPGEPGLRIYIPRRQGCPVIPLDTGQFRYLGITTSCTHLRRPLRGQISA